MQIQWLPVPGKTKCANFLSAVDNNLTVDKAVRSKGGEGSA